MFHKFDKFVVVLPKLFDIHLHLLYVPNRGKLETGQHPVRCEEYEGLGNGVRVVQKLELTVEGEAGQVYRIKRGELPSL